MNFEVVLAIDFQTDGPARYVCMYLRTVVIDVSWRHFTRQIYASGRDSKECI